MTGWPKYASHKVVSATPIIRIDKVTAGADVSVLPQLFVDPSNGREPPVRFEPTEPNMATRCQVLDYAMIYRDGYRSVCPKKEFEDGYSAEPPA
jgi:hypothetical protein